MSMRFSTRVGGGGGGGGGDSNVVAEGPGLLLPEGVGNWREFPAVRDREDGGCFLLLFLLRLRPLFG